MFRKSSPAVQVENVKSLCFIEESYLSDLSCVYIEVFGDALEVSWIPLEARLDSGMVGQTCRRELEVDNVPSGIL